MTTLPSVTLHQATTIPWDALVVGAGPAGSLAARQLAREGLQVLLVDKAEFPRWKVCGCCLNARALSTLRSVGLPNLVSDQHAVPVHSIHLAARRQAAQLKLQETVALSREGFDSSLIDSAIQAGVSFLPNALATPTWRASRVSGGRTLQELRPLTWEARLTVDRVKVTQNGHSTSCKARVILAADGLGGRFLDDQPAFRAMPSCRSWMGLGAVTQESPAFYASGTIFMATGRQGYVGLVRLEDGRLDIAAAFDRDWIKQCQGPAFAVTNLLKEVQWPLIPSLSDHVWRGTPLLTRQAKRVAGERLFVLGDASGYVEPFTGEGIAWALTSAAALAPLAARAARQWESRYADQWSNMHRHLVRKRQQTCRVVTWGLRYPALVQACLGLLSRWPGLAEPVVRQIT